MHDGVVHERAVFELEGGDALRLVLGEGGDDRLRPADLVGARGEHLSHDRELLRMQDHLALIPEAFGPLRGGAGALVVLEAEERAIDRTFEAGGTRGEYPLAAHVEELVAVGG